MRCLVTGAGGFIGSHLVNKLKSMGYFVRGADLKFPEYETTKADEFYKMDLRDLRNTLTVTCDMDMVFQLAADMGGMGYVYGIDATIMRNNTSISLNMIESSRINNVKDYLVSSSACVYPEAIQTHDVKPLKEEWAFPANPQDGYSWEKLYSELLCRFYRQQYGMRTRAVRFHNIFGVKGTWRGGKEKSPAALCRKVAEVADGGEIEIWGDGTQLRSFCYVDDAVEGVVKLMHTDYFEPINIGSERMISITDLAKIIIGISGKKDIGIKYVPGPLGVIGRTSDNTRVRSVLGWEPEVSLEDGLAKTYEWINEQVWGK